MSGIIAEFNEGGIFMYIILGISIFALALIIKKFYQLYFKYRIQDEEVIRSIGKQLQANNFTRAIEYCNGKAHPLTTILKAGLLRANKSEKEIRRAMAVVASKVVPQFKRGVAFLPHLSNISTMVGLLGTIRGLIMAFSGMEGGDAVKRQEALSGGIAIAFRATFFALSVAAALVAFFVILSNKQNRMLERMEHASNMLVDMLVTKQAQMLKQSKPS